MTTEESLLGLEGYNVTEETGTNNTTDCSTDACRKCDSTKAGLFFSEEIELLDLIMVVLGISEKIAIVSLFVQLCLKRKVIRTLKSKIYALEREVARSEYVMSVMEAQQSRDPSLV